MAIIALPHRPRRIHAPSYLMFDENSSATDFHEFCRTSLRKQGFASGWPVTVD